MAAPQSTTTAPPSLGRDVLGTARDHLGTRWALLGFGVLAVGLGLYFGGWGWLVAVGLAPIILSTLPCLIMCGLGVCAMCRFGKSGSTPPPVASDTAAMLPTSEILKVHDQTVAVSSCCQGAVSEKPAQPFVQDSKEAAHG